MVYHTIKPINGKENRNNPFMNLRILKLEIDELCITGRCHNIHKCYKHIIQKHSKGFGNSIKFSK